MLEAVIGIGTFIAESYMAFRCWLDSRSRKKSGRRAEQSLSMQTLREAAELDRHSMEAQETLVQVILEELAKREV